MQHGQAPPREGVSHTATPQVLGGRGNVTLRPRPPRATPTPLGPRPPTPIPASPDPHCPAFRAAPRPARASPAPTTPLFEAPPPRSPTHLVAGVVGVHGHGHVPQHRLGARRGHRQLQPWTRVREATRQGRTGTRTRASERVGRAGSARRTPRAPHEGGMGGDAGTPEAGRASREPLTVPTLHGVSEGDEDAEGDGLGTARDAQRRGTRQGAGLHLPRHRAPVGGGA